MTDTRKRLVAAAARLEQLHQRNTAQGAELRSAAGQMADRATTFGEGTRDAVLAGDEEAAAQRRHALLGRHRARELARGPA